MTTVTTAGDTGTTPGAPPAIAPAPRRSPERIAASLTVLVVVGLAVAAIIDLELSPASMLSSLDNAARFFGRVGALEVPPLPELLHLTALTLGLVISGTLLAAILSAPIAYLAAANTTPSSTARALARAFGVGTRAVPDVVFAMAFVLIFSLGTLPGVLAIGIHSIGMISKMFADAIEQIDEGPRRAIRAAGGSRAQEFFAGVLPQVLPSWVATALHRNDINLRGSVLLGYVGVAGLGLEMSHAFRSLDYGLGLGIAVVMFVLCVLMEIVSSVVRAAMLGTAGSAGTARKSPIDRLVQRMLGRGRADAAPRVAAFAPSNPEAALRQPWTGSRIRGVAGVWTAIVVLVLAVLAAEISWGALGNAWARIPDVAGQFWPPSFGSYGFERMLGAMVETIAIALAATLLTFLGSMVIGSLAANNVAPTRGIRSAMRLVLVGIRGVPEVILAIVLIVITGLGAQAGTLALALAGVGLLGKLLADSIEEVDRGPERALHAVGASRLQVYGSATFPQATPAVIGHTLYLLDTNVRAATILGIVGGGGIGYYLLNASQGSNYGMVTAVVLMILVTVLMIEGLGMWLRRVFR